MEALTTEIEKNQQNLKMAALILLSLFMRINKKWEIYNAT